MSAPKKRKLPAWMKPTQTQPSSLTSDVSDQSVTSNSLSKESPTDDDCGRKATKEDLSDSDSEETSATTKDVCGTMNNDEANEIEQRLDSGLSELITKATDNEEESTTSNTSPVRQRLSPDAGSSGINTLVNHSLSPGTGNSGHNGSTSRPSCYYGSSCYRKNPQHRVDFAHPGDNDYCDQASTSGSPNVSTDKRPLCEYGSSCYRKNPQHRRDFRHDAPQKRKARPVDLQDIASDDDGDFNGSIGSDNFSPGESESDDSFITSDSGESGNSDYDPDDDDEGKAKKAKVKKIKQGKEKQRKKTKKPKTN